jgi:putative two-component system response regulator
MKWVYQISGEMKSMERNYALLAKNADILIVDDTQENLSTLSGILDNYGYGVKTVSESRFALQAARENKPDLILLDMEMPETDGYGVCQLLKEAPATKDIPVLFISASVDVFEKAKAFRAGGADYISLPFQAEEVIARVDTHLHLHKLEIDLTEQVENQVREVTELQMAVLFGMAKLAEARDVDTGEHLERCRILCKMFAEYLIDHPKFGKLVDQDYADHLYNASPLHDIGKVGVLDMVLLKPGKLTPEEFEIMKSHTVIGANTLAEVRQHFQHSDFLNMSIDICRSHHEKWNGMGYPDGLHEDEIPLAARIMSIVDVYDAARSKRVYKPPFSHEKSCSIIREGSGTFFDPHLVEVFNSLDNEFTALWESISLPGTLVQ